MTGSSGRRQLGEEIAQASIEASPTTSFSSKVAAACRAGAAGVAVGRNAWQREDPAAIVRALAQVVRDA